MKTKTLLFVMAITFLGTAAIAQTTFPGLVGHWKFDEGTGTAVVDDLGTTNGELVNSVAATWTDGFMGKGVDFSKTSGSPAYARFAGDGVADLNESFTISMWVKSEMPDGEYSLVSKGVPWLETNSTDGGWYHCSLKAGHIRFMLWDTDNFSSTDGDPATELTWDANTWYHVVSVRDNSDWTIVTYLNGVAISTESDGVTGTLKNFEDFTLGSVATGVQTVAQAADNSATGPDNSKLWDSNYLGAMDEVQLYNVALTADDVKAMYDAYTTPSALNEKVISNLLIAPNPVADRLILQNASEITKLEIYNLAGVLIETINNSKKNMVEHNVSDLSSGTYIIKGYSENNTEISKSFVKR